MFGDSLLQPINMKEFNFYLYNKQATRVSFPGSTAAGVLMYVNENIPSRRLDGHTIPDDVEMCGEKPKKTKVGTIRNISPPNMSDNSFYDHLNRVLEYYSKKYDRIVILRHFNSERNDEHIHTFRNNLHNLVKEKTCFK